MSRPVVALVLRAFDDEKFRPCCPAAQHERHGRAPQSPYAPRVSVTPFVVAAPPEYDARREEAKELQLSEEVAAAFWAPVEALKRGGRSGVFRMTFAGVEREWPAYPSEHGMIWGITERILTEFLSLVD